MKLHNIVTVAAILVLTMVPLTAEAKKRHAPRRASTASYIDVLNYCRKTHGNGYDVNVYKQAGKWVCEYRIN